MCNGFGIDGPTVVAVGAVCLVFAVITAPIWVVGGVLYGTVKAGEAAVEGASKGAIKAGEKLTEAMAEDPEKSAQRRTTNVLKKVKNRMVKRLKAGEWQAYLQDVFERAKALPSRENLHELGVSFLLADDALKAEQCLDEALAAEPAVKCSETATKGRLARIHFARGLANQTIHDFVDAIEDFSKASEILPLESSPPDPARLSEANKVKEVFRAFDRNNDGLISRQELELLLLNLRTDEWSGEGGRGDEIWSDWVKAVFDDADKNADGMLSYEEFVDWVMAAKNKAYNPESLLDPEAHHPEGEGAGPSLPPLTRAECLNSLAYAQYLQALYVIMPERRTESSARRSEVETLLKAAVDNFTTAIAVTEGDPRAMFIYNLGRAKYYLALLSSMERRQSDSTDGESPPEVLILSEEETELMTAALEEFKRCVAISNFNTAAEGWAMCAQAHAVLGNMAEADAAARQADETDRRVFLVDITSPDELLIPWPLPKSNQAQEDECHNFEEKRFKSPHFCDHCLKLIKPLTSNYCCTRCEFRVHKKCIAKASKLRTCWKESGGFFTERFTQGKEVEARESHVHKMKEVLFHKPTWCDACGLFVHWPQGYTCVECGYRIHKNCLDETKCFLVGDDL